MKDPYNNRPLIRAKPSPETIKGLCAAEDGLLVSLYMPVEPPTRLTPKNEIQLRNLLDAAEERLIGAGRDPKEAHAFLQQLRHLGSGPEFFRMRDRSCALFVDERRILLVDFDEPAEAVAMLSKRFYVKPLLSYLHEKSMTVLCLNRKDIRCFRGNRLKLEPVEITGMPKTLQDVIWADDPERTLQHHASHTQSVPGRAGSQPGVSYHGQGLPADHEDKQIKRLYQAVAKAVQADLEGRDDVLIVVGEEGNIGAFRSEFGMNHQKVLEIKKDASSLSVEKLRQQAWESLRSVLSGGEASLLATLEEARRKGSGLFSVEQAAPAAANGRIDSCVVASDVLLSGHCDPNTLEVNRAAEANVPESPDDYDLLDYVAAQTLLHGGSVYSLESDKIPGEKAVAALLRY